MSFFKSQFFFVRLRNFFFQFPDLQTWKQFVKRTTKRACACRSSRSYIALPTTTMTRAKYGRSSPMCWITVASTKATSRMLIGWKKQYWRRQRWRRRWRRSFKRILGLNRCMMMKSISSSAPRHTITKTDVRWRSFEVVRLQQSDKVRRANFFHESFSRRHSFLLWKKIIGKLKKN